MPSYEQIREIEHQLYNVLNDFKFITENPDFKQIFDDAEKYDKEKNIPPTFLRAEHQKMMCRLYTYIVNRIPRNDALKMILDEFHCQQPIILSRIVDEVYITQNRKMRANKIYAAQMMKKAGVTNKKIAAVLNLTSTTISQYLKIKLEIND